MTPGNLQPVAQTPRVDPYKFATALADINDKWRAGRYDLADSLVRKSPHIDAFRYKQAESFFRQLPEVTALNRGPRTPIKALIQALLNTRR